jgi:hypothetical protein
MADAPSQIEQHGATSPTRADCSNRRIGQRVSMRECSRSSSRLTVMCCWELGVCPGWPGPHAGITMAHGYAGVKGWSDSSRKGNRMMPNLRYERLLDDVRERTRPAAFAR